jgi:hypothetical protein
MELAQEVERMKDAKKDYVVPSRMVGMQELGGEDQGKILFDGKLFTPTEVFHEQLSEKLQIPKKYYDRMQADAPALLARNVNQWMGQSEDRRMVRTVGGQARALLSDRYRPLDNDMILEGVLPVLMKQSGLTILSSEITERRLYLQVVNERVTGDVKVGDTVQAGLTISNSEVGLGSVRIEPLLYRLICLNGCIMPTAMRKNHVGKQAVESDGYDFYRPETVLADNRAFMMKIEDTVRNAFDMLAFSETIKKLTITAGNKIEGKPLMDVVEDVTARFDLGKGEGETLLQNLINGGDLSQWGLANAITAMANTTENYDRAVEFERIGGRVIDLSPADWRTMAQA